MFASARLIRVGAVGCLLYFATVTVASDAWVEFKPPLDITLRNKNRSVLKGSLVRFDHDKVIVDVRAAGVPEPRPVHVKLNQIASLRSTDGEFQYLAGDDLDQIIRSARHIEGASVVGISFKDDDQPAADKPEMKTPAAQPDDDLYSKLGQKPPVQNGTGGKTPGIPATDGEKSPSPTEMRKPELGETLEIVVCGECRKEVEVSSKYGQKCPHCGVEWAVPVAIPRVAPASDTGYASTEGGAGAGHAGGMHHQAHQVRAAQQPGGPQQLDIPPPPAPNMGIPEEMNFANLPLWMKAALFIGSVAVMYYLFFVRR